MILKGGLFQVELMLLKVKVSEKLTSGLWATNLHDLHYLTFEYNAGKFIGYAKMKRSVFFNTWLMRG